MSARDVIASGETVEQFMLRCYPALTKTEMALFRHVTGYLCRWTEGVDIASAAAFPECAVADGVAEVRGILAALAAAGIELVEWQPIETAPKDGTMLLGYDSILGAVVKIQYDDERSYAEEGVVGFMSDECRPNNDCTHWSPLPHGPTNNKGE